MKELRCGMKDCGFNRGYECRAKRINVDGKADCKTYKPNGNKVKNDNVMYEAGMDNYFSDRSARTDIDCLARKCLFNRAEKCVANGISVISDAEDAKCASYINE